MVTYRDIAVFNPGEAPHFGSLVKINRGDTINSFTLELAHLPKSTNDYGVEVKSDVGRNVQAAIWIVDNNWNITHNPIYVSSNNINTNDKNEVPLSNNPQNIETRLISFNFQNAGPIMSEYIIVGLVAVNSDSDSTSISYVKQPGTTVYYQWDTLHDDDSYQTLSPNGIKIISLKRIPYENLGEDDIVDLKLSNITYRTLSDGSGVSSPTQDITDGNTLKLNPFNRDYTFDEGYLKDVILLNNTDGYDGSTILTKNDPDNPYWVHNRSQIKFTFKKYPQNGNTSLRVSVGSKGVNTLTREVGNDTKVIICPVSYGIEDNSAFSITFTRILNGVDDKEVKTSESLTVYFHTYVTPHVEIGFPKIFQRKTNGNSLIEKSNNWPNYVLWANDVINFPVDSREAGMQICDVLDLLLTKDSGDDSKLPLFTRIHIAEYPMNQDKSQVYAQNTNILNGNNQPFRFWEGIKLDDGTLIQISGMKPGGYYWTTTTGEENNIKNQIASDFSNITGDDLTYIQNQQLNDHRIYFRANYRYLISVRRFHSAVAGVFDNDSYRPWKTVNKGGIGSGGKYTYNNSTYPGWDGTTQYPTYSLEPAISKVNSLNDIKDINNSNIVIAMESQNRKTSKNSRWNGPDDGSTLNKTSPGIYPGFSESDAIIVDCVNTSLGSKNIITTRPASQEINANSWITFAYRHIEKSLYLVNEKSITSENNCKKLNPSTYKLDGINTGWDPKKDYTASLKNTTWGGFDNTWTRIHNVYTYICDPLKTEAKTIYDSQFSGGWGGSLTNTLKVTLKTRGIQEPTSTLILLDSSFKLHETVFSSTWNNNVASTYNLLLTNVYTDLHPMIGQRYTWIPIINAVSDSNTMLKISTSENNIITKDPVTENKLDINHYFEDNNTIQGEYYTTVSSLHGINENPGEPLPSNMTALKNFHLSTSLGGGSSANLDSYGKPPNQGSQYFNSPGNESPENSPISYNIASQGYQINTENLGGQLYKRVPLSQDCENGNITTIRIVSPLNDVLYPLVRTSHMLYFQSFVSGDIEISGTLKGTLKKGSGEEEQEKEVNITWSEKLNTTLTQYLNPLLDPLAEYSKDWEGDKPKLIRIYGKDNNGRGLLLSANDDTSPWYVPGETSITAYSNWGLDYSGTPNLKIPNDGAIEIPIRVRYTPLMQPAITFDSIIFGNDLPKDTLYQTNNSFSVITSGCSGEKKNTVISGGPLDGNSEFSVTFTYGMYKSVFSGRYISENYIDSNNTIHEEYQNLKQQELLSATNPPTVGDNKNSTDIYPAVGICNCYMIILFPTNIDFDYTHQVSNFYANRDFENESDPNNESAKPVIVADLAFNKSTTCDYSLIVSSENADDIQIDNQYRTLFTCKFDLNNLLRNTTLASGSSNDASARKNTLKTGVWYDLVVVPIYSNHATNGGGKTVTFDYIDGAGTINGKAYGGTGLEKDSDEYETSGKKIDYYGSTPLVIKKYLKIANEIIDDDSCPPVPPEPQEEDISRWLSPAIVFPNINNKRYNKEGQLTSTSDGKITQNQDSLINECPGFWLNNTFRLIIRGPHFRTNDEIIHLPSTDPDEISIQSASNGKLSSSKDFQVSDIQIHFGNYKEKVTVNGEEVLFNNPKWQQEINMNSANKQWLNSHGIYSMSLNPEAFSKCTPAAKAAGDKRDVIKGGVLGMNTPTTLSSSAYGDRFFEVNPSILGIQADSAEGYHIQFRYLNAEYSDTSEGGQWSAWYGGLIDDVVVDTNKDYCVPVRNYNEIFTDYRNFIKESYPGSAITQLLNKQDEALKQVTIEGSGTTSPILGEGNHEDTPTVPSVNVPVAKYGYVYADNTDFPYAPQIWDERLQSLIENGVDAYTLYSAIYPTQPDSDEDKLKQYFEMSYIDYIIHNMAKLYYSTFEGAYIKGDNNNLLPKDTGWTKALAYCYDTPLSEYSDPIITTRNPYPESEWDYSNKNILTNENPNNPAKWGEPVNITEADITNQQLNIPGKPANRDRYFRKTITQANFDELLITLQNMMKFIRAEKFTGKHVLEGENTSSTADGISYFAGNDAEMTIRLGGEDISVGSGLSVLPISPEALEFVRNSSLYPPYSTTLYNDGVRNINGMMIGNNTELYEPGYGSESGKNETANDVVSNYMQQLLNAVFAKVIQPIPSSPPNEE